jgi:protein arginine kinase activator
MLCDICKHNEATIFYKEIVNDKQTELHLCEACAQKKGVSLISPLSISDLLGGLVESEALLTEGVELRCNACGLAYTNFCERGRFGCSECYRAFSKKLPGIFRKIHGSVQHTGKEPMGGLTAHSKMKRQITQLRQELQAAIKAEEFEKAAELRDKIKMLEKEMKEE